ncbi:MAG: hypothetical protein IJP68_01815, partial [Selenomonadaceae bacterium]|nr:hypothetical protein [Selenomonadaceae bacterium]
MKNAALISATIAIMMLLTGEVHAADFVEQRRFAPQIKIPRQIKDNPRDFYAKRYPPRPTPRYMP